jgi:hypothetical protein
MDPSLVGKCIELIDLANAKDPNQDEGQAKELLYSQRMSSVLAEFSPNASGHLQIAARAQHIERWCSPRSDFPEGRSGYKKWRSQLILHHAKRAGDLMEEAGASSDDVARVRFLIQKRQMNRDTESQTLEDVVCLVFLSFYFEAFAAKHEEDKLIDIIIKTWGKMSEDGRAAALKIRFKPHLLELVQKALAQ